MQRIIWGDKEERKEYFGLFLVMICIQSSSVKEQELHFLSFVLPVYVKNFEK